MLPTLGTPLSQNHLELLQAFTKSCRKSILEMVTNAQSGHPGGSLSAIDYLSTIYLFIISQRGDDIIVSNGHISPALYSVLAELKYIPKDQVITQFRKINSLYEGHVTRHVKGVLYGTGPLGIGVSVATGFALAEKIKKSAKKVYCLMGDGESQEGQVHEMIHFAKKYHLSNLILFVDYNRVQLSDSLEKIMPIDLPATFKAGGWKVLEIDGHDYQEIWDALSLAEREKDLPIVIIGHTIMGKGVDFMEEDGLKFKAEWHGKAPKIEMAAPVLKKLELNSNEKNIISTFHSSLNWRPLDPDFTPSLARNNLNPGTPRLYDTTTLTDCRSAYGKALLDLAKLNPEIVAITADLSGSVMTKYVMEELPERHFDCGIAEQHMVSMAGGLSLKELIPFVSTFGAFISSRAKDQARVNDINRTNLKMVATHCGLSVGEDGPTHQSIDDMGSFLGLLNTMIIEPVDPNQTDHIIRYIACHYGNFYVRMGRHKFPVITKKDGRIYFDQNYQFYYGKCDLIREGKDCTIIATGAMVSESLKAIEKFSSYDSNFSVELISASSIKKFDETLLKSVQKTKKIITVEDHNTYNGLGSQIALYLALKNIHVKLFKTIGVDHYQLSGKVEELYKAAKIDSEAISKTIISLKSYT